MTMTFPNPPSCPPVSRTLSGHPGALTHPRARGPQCPFTPPGDRVADGYAIPDVHARHRRRDHVQGSRLTVARAGSTRRSAKYERACQTGAYRCAHEATDPRRLRKGGTGRQARTELRICALFETVSSSLLAGQNGRYTGDHLRISAGKSQRGSPVYLPLHGPEGLVIFDHPYNGGSALPALGGSLRPGGTELPLWDRLSFGVFRWSSRWRP
jgi:hypothetical protein